MEEEEVRDGEGGSQDTLSPVLEKKNPKKSVTHLRLVGTLGSLSAAVKSCAGFPCR